MQSVELRRLYGRAFAAALVSRSDFGQRAAATVARRRIDGYLQYYGKLKNQEGMLRDKARVDGYKAGLEAASCKIQGATVMDIGTGSGIMALLAARCGAKKVYAVEASPEMARVASRLVRANGFVGVVEVVPKHLEEVTEEDIPAGSVDVIVSELFSHFLVGELGLQPVTVAKRRFLRPGGLILPEVAWLKLSPFEDPTLAAEIRGRHAFWKERNFYGFDLTSVLPIAEEQALRENICDVVDPESLLVLPPNSPGIELDLASPDDPAAWQKICFEVVFPRRSRDAIIDGLCGWWDIIFSGGGTDLAPVLSTAPDSPPTVWAQTRFLLNRPLAAKAGARLTASVDLKTHEERESYTLLINVKNHSTGQVATAGPINLSNVYARHFASPLPFPQSDTHEKLAPSRNPLSLQ